MQYENFLNRIRYHHLQTYPEYRVRYILKDMKYEDGRISLSDRFLRKNIASLTVSVDGCTDEELVKSFYGKPYTIECNGAIYHTGILQHNTNLFPDGAMIPTSLTTFTEWRIRIECPFYSEFDSKAMIVLDIKTFDIPQTVGTVERLYLPAFGKNGREAMIRDGTIGFQDSNDDYVKRIGALPEENALSLNRILIGHGNPTDYVLKMLVEENFDSVSVTDYTRPSCFDKFFHKDPVTGSYTYEIRPRFLEYDILSNLSLESIRICEVVESVRVFGKEAKIEKEGKSLIKIDGEFVRDPLGHGHVELVLKGQDVCHSDILRKMKVRATHKVLCDEKRKELYN